MATDWASLAAEYRGVNEQVYSGKKVGNYQALRENLKSDSYLPDIGTFDPVAFDPYAHLSDTTRRSAERRGYSIYQAGSTDYGGISQASLDKAQAAYVEAAGALGGAPVNSYSFDAALANRNARYKDYAELSKQFYNSLQSQGSAELQTKALQGKMRDLIKGQQAEFFEFDDIAGADVRIGSNIKDQRAKKRTSTSTDARTARSKTVVRAPGINI